MTAKISVCMAAYNGEKFIKRQIESIINQLREEDELIIVDDCSTDKTINVIRSVKDPRIVLHVSEVNVGYVASFGKALSYAKGDIIFLSDQDDEWYNQKVDNILSCILERNVDLVQHDACIVDSSGRILYSSWAQLRDFGTGIFKNFYKNTYVGCCMAFKRAILENVLPIPEAINHDQWIGIVSELCKYKVFFLDKVLINYNRHGENTTKLSRNSYHKVISYRIRLLFKLLDMYMLKRLSPNKNI